MIVVLIVSREMLTERELKKKKVNKHTKQTEGKTTHLHVHEEHVDTHTRGHVYTRSLSLVYLTIIKKRKKEKCSFITDTTMIAE